MTKKDKLGWGACGALVVAFLSLFMNYLSVFDYGISGFKLLGAVMEYIFVDGFSGLWMVLAVAATAGALITAWMDKSTDGNFSISVMFSIASVIFMLCFYFFGLSDMLGVNIPGINMRDILAVNMMDFAGTGLWVFVIAHLVAAVLGFEAGIPVLPEKEN